MAYKTRVKNAINEVRLAIENKGIEDARLSLSNAISILQQVQAKGVMHKNTASRKISRLTLQVNKLAATGSEEDKGEKLDSPPQDPPVSQS
jgi:small subunit ribosomal protein S20